MRGIVWAGAMLLAGCGQNRSEASQNGDIEDFRLSIAQLQSEVRKMKEDAEFEKKYLRAVSASLDEARENHTKLRATFNSNVDLDNKAKVARLTSQGYCGTEMRQLAAGGWVYANKECTLKDLR